MNETIKFPNTSTTTKATALVIGTGALFFGNIEPPVNPRVWLSPTPNYEISQDTPSFSYCDGLVGYDVDLLAIPRDFTAEVAQIFSELSKDQEPLGSDFEAVLNANLNELYES